MNQQKKYWRACCPKIGQLLKPWVNVKFQRNFPTELAQLNLGNISSEILSRSIAVLVIEVLK